MTTKVRIHCVEDFLALCQDVKKRSPNSWQALCFNHDDHERSLSIKFVDDKILLHCFAGCRVEDILAKAGLSLADLYLNGSRVPEALYQYRGKDGSWLYDKQKFVTDGKKEFIPRRLTPNGELVYDLKGVERLPYNLPEVESAIGKGETILLVEGEKDAETARILGFAGTTFGGAGDWRDTYKVFFTGAKVVQIPDNDQAGVGLAQKATKSLTEVCTSLKVLILPDAKDLTDWVSKGRSRAELDKLISEAPELIKKNDWQSFTVSHSDLLHKDLPPLAYLVNDLITTPSLVLLAGKKKKGKSWMCLQLAQAVANGSPFLGLATKQVSVLYVALEDGERRLKQRLEMQHSNMNLDVIYAFKLPPLNTPEGLDVLANMIQSKRPGLVVIDCLAAAKNRLAKENEADTMGDLFNSLHSLALANDTVILLVQHHGKANYNDVGDDIRGSSVQAGAADTILGLYRLNDGSCELRSESRDMAEVNLRIKLDKEITWCWQNLGDSVDLRRAESESRILEALDELGEADAASIAEHLDLRRSTVQDALKRMRESGKLDYKSIPIGKTKKLIYSLPNSSPTSPTPYSVSKVDEVVNMDKVDDVDDVNNNSKDTLTNEVDEVDKVGGLFEASEPTESKPVTKEVTLPVTSAVTSVVTQPVTSNLGQQEGTCYKDPSGDCALRQHKKSNFSCAYEPVRPDGSRCCFWRPK
jgi:putative DNA primase/helicase